MEPDAQTIAETVAIENKNLNHTVQFFVMTPLPRIGDILPKFERSVKS